MLKKIFKTILWVMTAIFIITIIICVIICWPEDYLPEYDNGYFRYAVRTYKGGKKEGYLVGFTEEGLEQTAVVLPQELDGIPIVGIGYKRKNTMGYTGLFDSKNLKRMYMLKNYSISPETACRNCYLVRWKDVYFENGFSRFYHSGEIVGYNVYIKLRDSSNINGNYISNIILANVSYMYNYEGAEDEGYYWVDSYDNGLIEYIPPEPVREGYSFGGWYKEAECINKWDFAVDKTGDELIVDPYTLPIYAGSFPPKKPLEYDENDGTKLYAKWIKN